MNMKSGTMNVLFVAISLDKHYTFNIDILLNDAFYLFVSFKQKFKSLITNFHCAIFLKVLVIYNFYKHSMQNLKFKY